MKKEDLNWEGCFSVMIVPFEDDGSIDEKGYIQYTERMLMDGAGGIMTLGHNSECWALSKEEKKYIAKLTVDVVNKRAPVVIGADDIEMKALIESCNMATEVGADGVMVPPPYILGRASRDEIMYRYQRLSDETELPIMLYNNPRRTQIYMTPDMIDELADIDKVMAIKNTIDSMSDFATVLRKCSDRMIIFANTVFCLPLLIMGADGMLATGPIEIIGQPAKEFYEKAKRIEITDDVKKIYFQICELMKVLWKYGTWPATLKAALDLVGKPSGCVRPPVMPISPQDKEKLKRELIELDIPVI